MSNWYSIIFGIIILGIIIVFHEFGHFIVAKKNGINVTEFMVGLGPIIYSKTKNGTKYSLRLIPFGGACVMQGDDKGIPEEEEEKKDSDLPEEGSFQSKGVWQRIAVIFAGPFFNFVLAYVVAVIVIGVCGVDKPVLRKVMDNLPAKEAGFLADDRIIRIDNTKIRTYNDLSLYMNEYEAGTPIVMTVLRDGEEFTAEIVPAYSETDGKKMLGIAWGADNEKTGVLDTLIYSANEVGFWIKLTFQSLGMLFTGKASVNDLSGPVGIVDIVDDTVTQTIKYGWVSMVMSLLDLMILLSANVGIMNLLPIPALDGGRLLFLLIEAVRGKPIDKQKEGYVHLAGMIFLLLLMVFILFNDFRKIFG